MKANYHTHTTRCHHARGSDEDYVRSAIAGGFEILGFSDHTPWNYASDYVAGMRMKLEQFQDYKQSVLALKEKYRGQIEILLGLEAEYFPRYMDWLKEFVKQEQLDYILFGNHFYQSDELQIYYGRVCADDHYLDCYVEDCIRGMESGLYAYLCHPDVFMRGRDRFDEASERASRTICEAAKQLHIPLEYNLEGLRLSGLEGKEQYPHHRFWEIAKDVGNTAIIGVDAHDNHSLDMETNWNEAVHYLDEVLEIKRVDHMEMKGF